MGNIEKLYAIDFDKVESFEDMKRVLAAINKNFLFSENSSSFKDIECFLKEKTSSGGTISK